jgi:hypothetical protein
MWASGSVPRMNAGPGTRTDSVITIADLYSFSTPFRAHVIVPRSSALAHLRWRATRGSTLAAISRVSLHRHAIPEGESSDVTHHFSTPSRHALRRRIRGSARMRVDENHHGACAGAGGSRCMRAPARRHELHGSERSARWQRVHRHHRPASAVRERPRQRLRLERRRDPDHPGALAASTASGHPRRHGRPSRHDCPGRHDEARTVASPRAAHRVSWRRFPPSVVQRATRSWSSRCGPAPRYRSSPTT